jgi:glycosyltransferase involved in cell wall biosynthesis
VHSDCAVTRFHAVTSNGGLYFQTYEEFEEVLNLLLKDEDLRKTLGAQGKNYVTTKYAWSAVLDRFLEALDGWDRLRADT